MASQEPDLPQVECPPCALRGSTLPVCSVFQQRQANNKSDDQPDKPFNKTVGVRQNRASQLRRLRALSQQYSVNAAASDAAVSTNSTDAISDEEEEGKEGSDEAVNSVARTMLAEAPKSRSSIVLSLMKSSDSADRRLNDLILQSIEVAPIPDLSVGGTEEKEETAPRTSKVSAKFNLSRLVEELKETAKQRNILKDRIADIARVMSPEPSQRKLVVGSDAAQPPAVGLMSGQQTSTGEKIKQLPVATRTSRLDLAGPSEESLYPSDSTASSAVESSTDSNTPPKKRSRKPKRLRRWSNFSKPSRRSDLSGNGISAGARSSHPVDHSEVQGNSAGSPERSSKQLFRSKRSSRRSGSTYFISQRKSNLSKPTSSTGTQSSVPGGLSSDQVGGADQRTENINDRNSCSAGRHSVPVGVSSTPVSSEDKATQQTDNQIEALVARLSEAAHECADLKLDREVARRELEAAKFDLRMTSVEVQERNVDLTQARREIELRNERIRQMSATQTRFEKEAGNLRNQLAEVRRQLDSVEKRYQAELDKNQRGTSQLTSLETQLNSRMAELTAVTNALIEKRSSEDELLLRIQQFQRALGASEEAVKRLTEQLTEEQRKNHQPQPQKMETPRQNQESQTDPPKQLSQKIGSSSSSSSSSSPTGSVAAAQAAASQGSPVTQTSTTTVPPSSLPASLPAGTLEQRMAELDARIARLVADTRGRGWRNDAEAVVTSTPRSPTTNLSTAENLSEPHDAAADPLLQRTAQLVASNQQLSQDVQSLRALCSDLLQSRQELKHQLMLSQTTDSSVPGTQQRPHHQHRHGIINLPHNELSGYLYATETLRAMIQRQVMELQSGGARRRPPPLSQELREQQEAVNRCWFSVERSFLAESHPADPSVHREFYLKRWRPGGVAKSSHAANLLGSVHQPQIQCTCAHSMNCPLAASIAASKEPSRLDSLPRKH